MNRESWITHLVGGELLEPMTMKMAIRSTLAMAESMLAIRDANHIGNNRYMLILVRLRGLVAGKGRVFIAARNRIWSRTESTLFECRFSRCKAAVLRELHPPLGQGRKNEI